MEPTETTPAELTAIHDRLDAGEVRMARIEGQVAENTALTRENTEITKDIAELLYAARLGLKVIGGIGSIAKWAGTVAAALVAIWGLVVALKSGTLPK